MVGMSTILALYTYGNFSLFGNNDRCMSTKTFFFVPVAYALLQTAISVKDPFVVARAQLCPFT
jgi:hypothetical protein